MKKLFKISQNTFKIRQSRFYAAFLAVIGLLFSILILSCNKEKEALSQESDLLLIVNDEKLYLQDVINKIPSGISPSDSASLFKAIVDSWIKTKVLSQFAEERIPNLDDIENKVEKYRNKLIIMEYLSRVSDKGNITIKPDSIKSYYEKYHSEILCETPMIKGIFVIIPETSENIKKIKNIIKSDSRNEIDKLENIDDEDDIYFEFLADKWYPWVTLSDQIPYRFGDPDKFLQENKDFEYSYNGNVYLFHIYEYLSSDVEAPYEIAEIKIKENLELEEIDNFEKKLISDLIKKSNEDQKIIPVNYNFNQ